MSVVREVPILLGRGMTYDGNGNPGIRGIAIGNYFWFVANPVAPGL